MAIEKRKLGDFLETQNVPNPKELGWLHTTRSARLIDIINRQKLLAVPCTVFKDNRGVGENLCYLFVGRPAYKFNIADPPTSWMLPTVFVFRFSEPPPIKRIFPFDSGAFAEKRMPSYITEFKLDRFNVGSDKAAVGRLISIFFKDEKNYFKRSAVGVSEFKEKHELNFRDMEIEALLNLYHHPRTKDLDERAATIEIQLEQNIALDSGDILGVVVPEEVYRDGELKAALDKLTPVVRPYSIFPLNPDYHYGLVYEQVQHIYKYYGMLR